MLNEITEQNVIQHDTHPLPISLKTLIQTHAEFKYQFRENVLFQAMQAGEFYCPQIRQRFFTYFQVWSNYFQKAMHLKTALCDDPQFIALFKQHFDEEFGHDSLLQKDISSKLIRKDPILEAFCHWFLYKIIILNLHEQIIVMNLCVEGAATIFYEYTKPFLNPENASSHFNAHNEIDHHHENIGMPLLENLSEAQYIRLKDILEESWAMINSLMKRLYELSIQADSD